MNIVLKSHMASYSKNLEPKKLKYDQKQQGNKQKILMLDLVSMFLRLVNQTIEQVVGISEAGGKGRK